VSGGSAEMRSRSLHIVGNVILGGKMMELSKKSPIQLFNSLFKLIMAKRQLARCYATSKGGACNRTRMRLKGARLSSFT
jgi:hypothetical protein